MSIESKRQYLPWTLAGVAFLLLVWEAAARIYGSTLILPGPLPVLESFCSLIFTQRFLSALGNSFLRVLGGIAIAVPLGVTAGIAAGLDKRIFAFLKPTFSVISATPVISVILILFLFLGSGRTPVFTAFLMVFPVITFNIIEGINSADSKLKELFVSFRMSRRETLKYLYIPTLIPFILGGLRSSLSLCWKVIVAAEVIVQPLRSLGTGMQHAKANLETQELFAWTAATVIAAALSQGALSL
ncbi:MAG: ABC transporter permease subunit, partial [Spirochaetaceae bacterium]|nr:ABC transporter permease subunit [Spirochaetaceae bacterium]